MSLDGRKISILLVCTIDDQKGEIVCVGGGGRVSSDCLKCINQSTHFVPNSEGFPMIYLGRVRGLDWGGGGIM